MLKFELFAVAGGFISMLTAFVAWLVTALRNMLDKSREAEQLRIRARVERASQVAIRDKQGVVTNIICEDPKPVVPLISHNLAAHLDLPNLEKYR